MGFFDDLEQQAASVPSGPVGDGVDSGELEPVLKRLEGGWVFQAVVARRANPKDRNRGLSTNQETEVRFEGGRFVVITRLVERRGDAYAVVHDETEHRLDRLGLVEHLADRPALYRKLCEAAGIAPTASDPDPRGY